MGGTGERIMPFHWHHAPSGVEGSIPFLCRKLHHGLLHVEAGGCVIASLGAVAVERDGSVVCRCFTDESRRKLMIRKYRLKKGEDEMKPQGPDETKAVEFRRGKPVFT